MIVYGHRGARGEAPENTIAGCQHALSRGVNHLEIDLRLAADGKLVVAHDATVNRTTDERGKVGSFSAAELSRMDARADGTPWPNKRRTGIPTLDALVKALPQINHWQLELKSGSERYNAALADAVAAWLDRAEQTVKVDQRFTVTSLEPTLLTEVKRQRPQQSIGFVSTIVEPEMILAACGCDTLVAHWSTLRERQLNTLKRRGIQVSCWTVNDASVIKQLYEMGVDSVITDYPSMAVPLVAALER